MRRSERRRLAGAGVVLAVFVAVLALAAVRSAAAASAPAPGPVVLRYASPYPPTHPFSRADITWMKAVEARSGGRLKIEPFWGGALISADDAVLELRHGVADMALITPIYMRGGAQAIKLQAGFYGGARTPDEQVAVYKCLQQAFPILQQEMGGLRVLAVQGGNLPNVLTRGQPVARLTDLRGLRLRAPAEQSELLRSLGADPVTMPMGDTYSALSKGIVDGVVAPADTIRSMHFSEVTRYRSSVVVARGAYPARAISDRAWARLPPELQAILTQAEPVWEDALTAEVTRAEAEGAKFGTTHGIRMVAFDPADQIRLDQLYNQMSLQIATRSAPSYGPAMFRRAQAVIADLRAGRQPAC